MSTVSTLVKKKKKNGKEKLRRVGGGWKDLQSLVECIHISHEIAFTRLARTSPI